MKKTMLILYVLTFLLFFLIPALAFAQEIPVEPTPAEEAFVWVMKMLFIVIAALGAFLVRKVIKFVEAKLKIDIPQRIEETLYDYAQKGVNLAEEKAYRFAKETGGKLTGSQKTQIALDFVRDRAKEYKLDVKAEQKLRDYVESHLGTTR